MKKKYYIVLSITAILILIVAIFLNAKFFKNNNINSLQISKYEEFNEDIDLQMVIASQQPLELDESLKYEIINNTNETIVYGEMYTLEVYNNGNWYTVKWKDTSKNYGWPAIGIILQPNSKNTDKIDLSMYQLYPSHKYRIVKEFNCESINSVEYVEFDLK